ncbi:MAG: replicative DNA helicase [Eubacteriales bacterium]|nr:replicative DNA helicase [Eubacteriales bacterium]MDD5810422.1 replicative DNA helicase [Clostridiales bacterium]MDY5801005.1 replicative DNA helicase [Eubacteriales bacterium]
MEEPRVPTTPPHSLEAEKSILGSMLLSHTAVEQAMETLCASDFYLARHQDIFQAIKGIYDRGEAIDSVTVIDALDRMGKLASVGGVMYITELSLYVPSAANAAHYIRIVEERSVMRQLIEASTAIASDAFSGEKSLEQMLDDAERAIFNISMKKTSDTLVHISETVLSCYNRVGELMKLNGALTGVTTGFADLDKLTSGMQPSDLIIIAGRPSMGKTAFALNLAQNAAIKGKKTVCIFSLEMSREQLVQRMLCSDSGVNMQSVRTGTITDAELIRIASSLDPLSKANIYIDDSAGCSVAEIRSKCRRLQSRVGLDMVVIDYLQLMQTSGKYDNRVLEISETTRKLKILARELNVPIILLSQLSRGPEQRTDHRPIMADLRESGAIEQDADVIMLLYRPAVYDAEADNTTEVIVAKHRNGPTATVKLAWIDSSAKFADLDTTGREEGF